MVGSQQVKFDTLETRIQDEAYTLAFYLSGSETLAVEATQAAFAGLAKRSSSSRPWGPNLGWGGDGLNLRVELLRRVMEYCRAGGHVFTNPLNGDTLGQSLLMLQESQRSAVILVDVLGLDYGQAAQVLGCSKKQAGRLLAQARVSLSQAVSA